MKWYDIAFAILAVIMGISSVLLGIIEYKEREEEKRRKEEERMEREERRKRKTRTGTVG